MQSGQLGFFSALPLSPWQILAPSSITFLHTKNKSRCSYVVVTARVNACRCTRVLTPSGLCGALCSSQAAAVCE